MQLKYVVAVSILLCGCNSGHSVQPPNVQQFIEYVATEPMENAQLQVADSLGSLVQPCQGRLDKVKKIIVGDARNASVSKGQIDLTADRTIFYSAGKSPRVIWVDVRSGEYLVACDNWEGVVYHFPRSEVGDARIEALLLTCWGERGRRVGNAILN